MVESGRFFVPHQVAAILTLEKPAREVAKPSHITWSRMLFLKAMPDGKLLTVISLSDKRALTFLDGRFTLRFIAADLRMKKNIDMSLFSFDFETVGAQAKTVLSEGRNGKKRYVYSSESDIYPRPPIIHTFADPPTKPPAALTFLFTIINTLAPIAVLGWLWSSADPSLFSPTQPIHIAFAGLLALIPISLVYGWAVLTLPQLFKLLIPQGVVLVLVGSKALSEVRSRRWALANKVGKTE